MNYAQKCPDCGSHLRRTATGCRCGWRQKAPAVAQGPQRCSFPGCPAAGPLSHDTHGGGPYWCRGHFSETGEAGERIVADFKEHGIPPSRYWCDVLIEERLDRGFKDMTASMGRGRLAEYLENLREAREERAAIQAEGEDCG